LVEEELGGVRKVLWFESRDEKGLVH
jgi:hypothetical protein